MRAALVAVRRRLAGIVSKLRNAMGQGRYKPEKHYMRGQRPKSTTRLGGEHRSDVA